MEQGIVLSSVFVGTSLQFSDQLMRILNFEFGEVRFVRRSDVSDMEDIAPQPRLIVLHESLPGLEKAIGIVRAQHPEAMIALGGVNPIAVRNLLDPDIARSLSLVSFNTSVDVWLSVLRLLLCGHPYIPAEQPVAVERIARAPSPCALGKETVEQPRLTRRETQILSLISEGLQNKVIAASLGVSEHTVKLHTHNIFGKIGVSNRTGAAMWYLSHFGSAERRGQTHDE